MIIIGILLVMQIGYFAIYGTLNFWFIIYWIWFSIYILNPSNIFYNK